MYLYILKGRNHKWFYIGITVDPDRRLGEHNTFNSHYTGKQNDTWEMVYCKYYDNESEARREEIRLKKAKNKKYIEWYIRAGSSTVEQ